MKLVRLLMSILLGCMVGILFHYVLYRMSIPVAPFIYMAF
jgi:hypothetical protein